MKEEEIEKIIDDAIDCKTNEECKEILEYLISYATDTLESFE